MKLQHISLSFGLPALMVSAGVLAGACGGEDTNKGHTSGDPTTSASSTSSGSGSSSSSSSGAGGAGGATGSGGAGGVAGPSPKERTITGDATWNVTFDAAAQMAGLTDCAYTRHYEGVEDRSAPWLCPSCEIMFRADVTMTAGAADCFPQVSSNPPAAQEWIGYGNGSWWRSPEGPTTMQGTAMVAEPNVTTMNSVKDSDVQKNGMVVGKLSFAINGSFTLGDQDGDPLHGWVPPATYACGWPKADPQPPAYAGDYVLAVGAEVPDGLFHDKCGETVRLHDFKGTYFVVDMSAMDCPPCQSMASEEEAFVADMKASGFDVHVITLLAPSLSNTLGTTTTANLNTWIKNFKLTSPVLADRGWGLAEFEPAIGAMNVGYPSWALVSPDLKVLHFESGYGQGQTFNDIKAMILADAMP